MEFIQIPLTVYWVLTVIWAQTGTEYSQDKTLIDRNDPWHTGTIHPSSGRAAEQVKQTNPAGCELDSSRATVPSSRTWAAGLLWRVLMAQRPTGEERGVGRNTVGRRGMERAVQRSHLAEVPIARAEQGSWKRRKRKRCKAPHRQFAFISRQDSR